MLDRRKLIHELVKKRHSYREISLMLGISRQRVFQIYRDYKPIPDNLRKQVLERDAEFCIICDDERRLEIHHIDGNSNNNQMKNLVTLCRKCHKKVTDLDSIKNYTPAAVLIPEYNPAADKPASKP